MKAWEKAQAEKSLDFENGKKLFSAALCFMCHRVGDLGGAQGPDLTSVGSKQSPADLLTSIIGRFEADVARITVTELKESTFYATLTLTKEGEMIDIDSRPSDALALAVRTDAPIFASTALIDENAIEFEREVDDTEEIVESFRDFLESVSPEDFNSAEGTPDEIAFAEADELDLDDEDDDDEDDDDEDDLDDLDDEEDAGPPHN